jgi:hypothetical protein
VHVLMPEPVPIRGMPFIVMPLYVHVLVEE